MRRRAIAVSIALTAIVSGCRCETEPSRPICAGACDKFVACDGGDRARCASNCAEDNRELEAWGCGELRRAHLECVAKSRTDCAPECADAAEKVRACTLPCRFAGTIYQAEGIEVVRAGCGACPDPAKGAPPGSPCTAASVCAQTCCGCGKPEAHFLVRACSDGVCADASRACALGNASRARACE